MCAGFVLDVDDARFLVTLQYHCLMTCGQHVVRECSFCVTMTRAFAKYNVGEECIRQSVMTSQIAVASSPMTILSVANFDTPPGLDS